MSNSVIQRAETIAQSAQTILARILDTNGNALVQSAVSSISVKVIDKTSLVVTGTYTATVSSAIYNTLQTNAIWTQDNIGYNFLYTIPPSAFPTGNTTYRVEVLITPQGNSNAFYLLYDMQALPIY